MAGIGDWCAVVGENRRGEGLGGYIEERLRVQRGGHGVHDGILAELSEQVLAGSGRGRGVARNIAVKTGDISRGEEGAVGEGRQAGGVTLCEARMQRLADECERAPCGQEGECC